MKTIYSVLSLFLFTSVTFSQVGINTAQPDASAALHIESEDSGVLIPRMTQAQINAIASPAEGLLTYNKDLNQISYYDGQWNNVQSDQQLRDNQVIVKSESDFPAPSGGIITLDPATTYQLDGEVIMTNSIDLNGSKIYGLFARRDYLLIATANPLFVGDKGGTLERMSVAGAPGINSTVFSLSSNPAAAAGPQNLFFQSLIFNGAASIGSITGYGLVFFDIAQFLNNDDGITFSNTGAVLLNAMGWDDSNSGTYETFSGGFQLIQQQSGFLNVSSGSVGVDITGVAGISGSAVMEGVVFLGDGDRVNGTSSYSGYSFPNSWTVDCPGLNMESDDVASGNFYYDGGVTNGFGFTCPASDIGVPKKIESSSSAYTTESSNLFRFSYPTDNKLVYEGAKTRDFQVNASLSIRVDKVGEFYGVILAVNGNVITESNSIFRVNNMLAIQNVAINSIVTLKTGDYVELYLQRITGDSTGAAIAIFSENLSIK